MRTLLALVVLVVLALFVFGYWGGSLPSWRAPAPAADADRLRERGAELGARAGEAVGKVGEALGDAALTAKIRLKMALDDTLTPLEINVDTDNGVVTLRGKVRSSAQRERALQLARETAGVREVKDHLVITN